MGRKTAQGQSWPDQVWCGIEARQGDPRLSRQECLTGCGGGSHLLVMSHAGALQDAVAAEVMQAGKDEEREGGQ